MTTHRNPLYLNKLELVNLNREREQEIERLKAIIKQHKSIIKYQDLRIESGNPMFDDSIESLKNKLVELERS